MIPVGFNFVNRIVSDDEKYNEEEFLKTYKNQIDFISSDEESSIDQNINQLVFPDSEEENKVAVPCAEAMRVLKEEGLTDAECKNIEEDYKNEIINLSSLNDNIIIKRKDKDNNIIRPRSLFVSPKSGVYVLLKTHGKSKERGKGGYGLVTDAIHLETGQRKAFKSQKFEYDTKGEIEANKKLSKYPEHFVTSENAIYKGDIIDRNSRELNAPKNKRLKKYNVSKAGSLMDLMENGELFDRLVDENDPFEPEQNPKHYKEACNIAEQISEAIKLMHKENLVHLDQKPENVLLTKDGRAKQADFGYTVTAGTLIGNMGSPSYISPELTKLINFDRIPAAPSMDVWQLGCVIGVMFNQEWNQECGDQEKNMWMLNPTKFERLKDQYFPGRKNPNHPMHQVHKIIDMCLQLKPQNRATAETVAAKWKQLNAKLTQTT